MQIPWLFRKIRKQSKAIVCRFKIKCRVPLQTHTKLDIPQIELIRIMDGTDEQKLLRNPDHLKVIFVLVIISAFFLPPAVLKILAFVWNYLVNLMHTIKWLLRLSWSEHQSQSALVPSQSKPITQISLQEISNYCLEFNACLDGIQRQALTTQP